MATQMKKGGIYDFSVYAPARLGSDYRRVEFMADLDYETAVILYGDIVALHREIMSMNVLPSGTPADPKQLSWYRIKKPDGSIVVLAAVWINESSVIPVEEGPAYIRIPRATTQDLVRLRESMKQGGINDFEIRFDNNFT